MMNLRRWPLTASKSIVNSIRNMCIESSIDKKALFESIKKEKNDKKALQQGVHGNKKIKEKPGTEEQALKVTVLSGDKLTVLSLAEAKKVAARRDLKLVKILDKDTKSMRPIYRLMTGVEYYEEDIKQRQEKKEAKARATIKGEKLLTMSWKIGTNDFTVKMNKVVKWLNKSFEVRVVIEGEPDSSDGAEKVYQQIEKEYGEHGRIVQKRTKGNDVRFQMLPLKKTEQSSTEPDAEAPTAPSPPTKPEPPITQQQVRTMCTSSSDMKSL